MGESSGKEGKADHIKLFRSKYPNVLLMLWRDKQTHLPWKPLKVKWEKGEKKRNTYKHIIKLAFKEVSLCMPFPALNRAFIYSSHYHIGSTQTYRSGHTKTMSSDEFHRHRHFCWCIYSIIAVPFKTKTWNFSRLSELLAMAFGQRT